MEPPEEEQPLTPLQQSALKRIRECRRELEAEHIFVRSAIELEFMAQDEAGQPLPDSVNSKLLERFLRAPEGPLGERGRYIQKIDYEARGGLGFYGATRPMVSSQYEIAVAEPTPDILTSPRQLKPLSFMPENVAGVTLELKEGVLRRMLESTSSLTPVYRGSHAHIIPNFLPRPYREMPMAHYPHYEELTSALQVNASLYDAQGNNLFAQTPALQYHCALALLDLQKEAAISMLPTEDSLWRLHANNSTPRGIGASIGDNMNDKPKNNQGKRNISVRIVREMFPDEKNEHVRQHTRNENRLPGSDADPLVAMAVTLSAYVDGLHRYRAGTEDLDTLKAKVKAYGSGILDPAGESASGVHRTLIAQYQQSAHARRVLGDELYEAINQAYAQSATLGGV